VSRLALLLLHDKIIIAIMKLSAYLKKKKLSQAAFAKELGVEREAVARWIAGIRRPRPEVAQRIVEITGPRGVSFKDIYGEL
jgi:transcriptional regulator with XRE-family HTH domain